MRIDCPNCDAEYEVQDHLLRPGRTTRCVRCGRGWVPVAVAVIEAAPEPPPPRPVQAFPLPSGLTAMERLGVPPARRGADLSLRLAWGGTILVLIGLLGGLYVERTRVMAAWAPSQRLYEVFGLAPMPESPHLTPQPK